MIRPSIVVAVGFIPTHILLIRIGDICSLWYQARSLKYPCLIFLYHCYTFFSSRSFIRTWGAPTHASFTLIFTSLFRRILVPVSSCYNESRLGFVKTSSKKIFPSTFLSIIELEAVSHVPLVNHNISDLSENPVIFCTYKTWYRALKYTFGPAAH